jgi:asparagine synthase (glutamine-hydrolysing)
MCGIVGLINYSRLITESDITSLNNKLISRGPDSEGVYVYKNVGLGHRRLSIIDLESGNQPMVDESGQIVIVFNGEIYNFIELREELVHQGIIFHTKSDTEVILKVYKRYGIQKTLELLEGMFAFAIYDRNLEKTIIARDKFGEKPLYYQHNKQSFLFASELKALEDYSNKEIDINALNLFMSLSYIPAPCTIYNDIRKLMPGSYCEINNNNGEIKFETYYDLLERIKTLEPITDFAKASKQLEELLTDAVKHRMVSDVPIGSFLSGGIDSSIISAIMAKLNKDKINTFSIGFVEKDYDESERAQLVSDSIKSNHFLKFLDYNSVVDDIDNIVLYYDEPFGDSSCIPSNYVAKLARGKVTVVLTGDCADELFGGYEKYLAPYYINRFKKLPFTLRKIFTWFVNNLPHNRLTNGILRRFKKVIENSNLSSFDLHYKLMSLGVSDEERKELLNKEYFKNVKPIIEERYNRYNNVSDQEKGYYTDLTTVLEGDMLVKVDRICMKNSLEARVPFLDSKIVEFAYRIPDKFKINGRNKKYILKETFKEYLPKKTLNYKKQGFGVPVDYWLKNQLKQKFLDLVSSELIKEQGIFNYDLIHKWFDEHITGKQNHKGKLWNLYVFQLWYSSKMK